MISVTCRRFSAALLASTLTKRLELLAIPGAMHPNLQILRITFVIPGSQSRFQVVVREFYGEIAQAIREVRMRIKWILIPLCMILLVVLFGCASQTPAQSPTPTPLPVTSVPQPPIGFLMYADNVNRFSIFYPEEWEMIPPQGTERIKYALVGFWDRQQNATLNSFYVMKADLPNEMDVEDYFELEKTYFPGEYGNYTSISTSTLNLNGEKAVKHMWSFTLGGDALQYVRLYLIDEKVVWLLEAGGSMESFNDYENTCDIMMSGFRVLR